MTASHRADLADGHEPVVRPVLDQQPALVGALHLDKYSDVLGLQLPNTVPEA